MSTPTEHLLSNVRFSGDERAYKSILGDTVLSGIVTAARQLAGVLPAREHVLSSSVKINPKLLPELSHAIEDVITRTGIREPFETYVYSDSGINASVIAASDRNLLMLSSAAVERLKASELDFVIGHELGHARYGHFHIPVSTILGSPQNLTPRQAMQLLAWQRKAEISADRAGLISCGSLGTAATALFKTLSGLTTGELAIDPDAFGAQWNDLEAEVARTGSGSHWMATHPFPPLRMKALTSFWRSDRAKQAIPEAPGGSSLEEADLEIESLLSMMDPLSRDTVEARDPVLQQFLLWGGLYTASANGVMDAREIDNIRGLVGSEVLARIGTIEIGDPEEFRKRFLAARASRRKPLSALELHKIFAALTIVARADGTLDALERKALHTLAADCGISAAFVDSLVS